MQQTETLSQISDLRLWVSVKVIASPSSKWLNLLVAYYFESGIVWGTPLYVDSVTNIIGEWIIIIIIFSEGIEAKVWGLAQGHRCQSQDSRPGLALASVPSAAAECDGRLAECGPGLYLVSLGEWAAGSLECPREETWTPTLWMTGWVSQQWWSVDVHWIREQTTQVCYSSYKNPRS